MLPFYSKHAPATAEETQSDSTTPQKGNQQLRHDAPQIRLADDDAENESEVDTTPAVPAIPDTSMPLAVYRAPSLLPSEDLSSSGGPSLAPPTLGTLDTPTTSAELPKLSLQPEFDDEIRNTPFEIESKGFFMLSTTVAAEGDPESQSPLPWKFEFRWEGEVLHSSWGPRGSTLMSFSRQSIDISSATVGGSNGFSAPTHASTVPAPRSDVSLHTAVRLEDEAYWAMTKRRGDLGAFLVAHYWRTHISQGANRRNRETRQPFANFPSSAPYATATPVRHSTRGRSSRRLANGGGSGGGEDDDDPDDGDDRFCHPEQPVQEWTRRFACPFQKWRPQRYKHCFHSLRHVSEVKTHVLKNHYIPRCPECHRSFKTPLVLNAHKTDTGCGARPTPDPTPGHISEQQVAIIKKRPVGQSLEKQWRNLFATIFPNEPQPRDIYVDRRADDAMQHIAHDYQRCCRHVLYMHQAEQARDDPFLDQYETLEAQREAVTEQFTPWVMYELSRQETSSWPPPFAVNSGSRNFVPGTVASGSSLFPPDDSQNQGLAHGFPLTLDSPRQNQDGSMGLYNRQAQGAPHVPPLLPNWHLGSHFSIQPINPPDANHAALDYQPMTTHAVEQQPAVVPQLGQDFHAHLHHRPNEDLAVVGPQSAVQPSSDSNSNSNSSINQAIPIGSSTVAWPPFVPGTHGFPSLAGADSCLSPPMQTNDAYYDNATTTVLATIPRCDMQWADMGSETPTHFDSSCVPYQGTWTN